MQEKLEREAAGLKAKLSEADERTSKVCIVLWHICNNKEMQNHDLINQTQHNFILVDKY